MTLKQCRRLMIMEITVAVRFLDIKGRKKSSDIIQLDHSYGNTGSLSLKSMSFHPDIEKLNNSINSQACCPESETLSDEEYNKMIGACKTKSVNNIATNFIKIETLKNAFMRMLMKNVDLSVRSMSNRKHLFVSKLMQKSTEDLKDSQWIEIVKEFQSKFPEIFSLIMSIMLRPEDLRCFTKLQSVIPRVAIVYGIMAQTRNVELSHVQRIMSLVLVDNICDQKV